jgi:AcrR family transcriptional regulator
MRARDENKERLIRQKAIEMIVKEGLDGFGVNKLAKAAGVSPATIYIYYKDKEELILRLGLEVSREMLANSLKDFDPEVSFAEGLKRQWLNRMSFFMKYPLEVQFIEQIRYSQYYETIQEALTRGFRDVMGEFVHNAIKRKELLPLPFEVYWSVAYAPLYQLIKFHMQGKTYQGKKFVLKDKTITQTLELVLKALKP